MPLFESKAKCEDDFHSHANKTHWNSEMFYYIQMLISSPGLSISLIDLKSNELNDARMNYCNFLLC